MDAYMVILLAVYARPPVHGFGVHKTGIYMTREAAERAINNAIINNINNIKFIMFYRIINMISF